MKLPRYKTAKFVRNPDASRQHTYDQEGNTFPEIPYIIISPPEKAFLKNVGVTLVAECWQGRDKTLFAGLISVPGFRKCYVSDWKQKGRDLIAIEGKESEFLFYHWPNYGKFKRRERIAFARKFFRHTQVTK